MLAQMLLGSEECWEVTSTVTLGKTVREVRKRRNTLSTYFQHLESSVLYSTRETLLLCDDRSGNTNKQTLPIDANS